MNYKEYLKAQFDFRDLEDKGYLMYSRVDNQFFYADHIMTLCAVVASCIDDVLKIENIGLLEKHVPGSLDEMVQEIAQECASMGTEDQEEFTKKVVDVCHTMHTIATVKKMNRKK